MLRKKTTGTLKSAESHWKPVRNWASPSAPRYSGKLNSMVLPKMKPATPKRMYSMRGTRSPRSFVLPAVICGP